MRQRTNKPDTCWTLSATLIAELSLMGKSNSEVSNLSTLLQSYKGFVYLITNTKTGHCYIGRKYITSKRRHKVKGKRRRKLVEKESDWLQYKSSSDELKSQIQKYGEGSFTFSILHLCKTRGETNYLETKEMFLRDVLYATLPSGDYQYLNHHILGRYYRRRK